MKAEELRIGNWVQHEDGSPTRVNAVWGNSNFEVHSNERQFWLIEKNDPDVSGIPLTPEILAKADLKERYAKGEWSWAACKAEGQWDSYTEIVEKPDGYKYIGGNYPLIKYVHELQNLYFALTGEELTIEL